MRLLNLLHILDQSTHHPVLTWVEVSLLNFEECIKLSNKSFGLQNFMTKKKVTLLLNQMISSLFFKKRKEKKKDFFFFEEKKRKN